MRRVLVAALLLMVILPAALGPPWPGRHPSHRPAATRRSAVLRPSPAAALVAGGRSGPGGSDVPVVWRRSAGVWTAQTIPVDLTGAWGFMTAVSADAPEDAWAVGVTVTRAGGTGTPLVAHRNGSRWAVVTSPGRVAAPPDQAP